MKRVSTGLLIAVGTLICRSLTAAEAVQAEVEIMDEFGSEMPVALIPQEGPAAFQWISSRTRSMLNLEQFKRLDDLLRRYAESGERFIDGRWKLTAADFGISIFGRPRSNEQWQSLLAIVEKWRKEDPASVGAALAEARIWYAWGWQARGTGLASTVTPQGWELLRDRLKRADLVLTESKALAAANPLWYELRLDVGLGRGWPKEQLYAAYEEAVKKFPGYFMFDLKMIGARDPRWGGTIDEMDALVRGAVERTRVAEGMALYARMYWAVDQGEPLQFNLFEETHAKWSLMKQGFEDLISQYPKSIRNASVFASFACRAGDAATYRRLRQQLGDRLMSEPFPGNYSIEICDVAQ